MNRILPIPAFGGSVPHAPAKPATHGKLDAMPLPSVFPVSDALQDETIGKLT